MATQRVSRLHTHILRWLLAEHRRTYGGMAMEHRVLVKALTGHKSNIRHSLRTLETRGGIVIGRTGGGRRRISCSRQQGSKKPRKSV